MQQALFYLPASSPFKYSVILSNASLQHSFKDITSPRGTFVFSIPTGPSDTDLEEACSGSFVVSISLLITSWCCIELGCTFRSVVSAILDWVLSPGSTPTFEHRYPKVAVHLHIINTPCFALLDFVTFVLIFPGCFSCPTETEDKIRRGGGAVILKMQNKFDNKNFVGKHTEFSVLQQIKLGQCKTQTAV